MLDDLKRHPVVFYDGECGMCDRSVQWVLAHDPSGIFRFATLQGETARRSLGEGNQDLRSVVLLDEHGAHRYSSAPLRIMVRLGGVWRLMGLFLAVPAFVRDGVYRFIARHRYKVFGKVDACRIPSPEVRTRFLP